MSNQQHFQGHLNSTDISAGVRVQVADRRGALLSLQDDQGLHILETTLHGQPSGDWRLFWANGAIATANPSANEITINGVDLRAQFPIGTNFIILESTGNNGTYKVTSVDYAGGNTTIGVASLPDNTGDGYICKGSVAFAATYARASLGANGSLLGIEKWGPPGAYLYARGPAGTVNVSTRGMTYSL